MPSSISNRLTDDEDLQLAFREGQWWLLFHRRTLLAAGDDPDAGAPVPPGIRESLIRVMQQRLAETLPRVQGLLAGLDARRATQIALAVVNPEDDPLVQVAPRESERGWPLFVLRLSHGELDVEVDLNPYVPGDPFDPEEVARQAAVLLRVVGTD